MGVETFDPFFWWLPAVLALSCWKKDLEKIGNSCLEKGLCLEKGDCLEKGECLEEGMAGKGGARHFSKPLIDQGLLYQVFAEHKDLVFNLKGYELLSGNSAHNPLAMHQVLPLIDALVDLESSAEIHAQTMRSALLHLITREPELNTSDYNGSVFVNLRADRISVVLHHVRRLARAKTMPSSVIGSLTATQFKELNKTLKKVVLRDVPQEDALKKDEGQKAGSSKDTLKKVPQGNALKKDDGQKAGSKETLKKVSTEKKNTSLKKVKKEILKKKERTLKKGDSPLKKEAVENAIVPKGRSLKARVSDVSLDSDGFPKVLASPQKGASPPRLWKKKRGNFQPQASAEVHGGLKDAMGVLKKPSAKQASLKKEKSKKPALKKVAKNEALKKVEATERKPWEKKFKTTAKNPERSYLTGRFSKDQDKFLIVEVTKKMSLQYRWIIDRIKDSLEKEHITKHEAIQMRESLCFQHP